MKYHGCRSGLFRSRPNRFIAVVDVDGREELCHVKNTGRCKELLVPGAPVILAPAGNPQRKTRFDLVSVYKGARLINMDSQAPNKIFAEWAALHWTGITRMKPECAYGNSRLDFYMELGERRRFVEVKGVTLEEDGAALFPDAPTERGIKHLRELARCAGEGFETYVAFVIQMEGVAYFTPNLRTHPAFGEALREAAANGVGIVAFDCHVTPDEVTPGNPVPVRL